MPKSASVPPVVPRTQHTFLIPEALDPNALHLPPGLKRDKALWLLDCVSAALCNESDRTLRNEARVFARLHSRVLQRGIWNYCRYLDHLVDAGIL